MGGEGPARPSTVCVLVLALFALATLAISFRPVVEGDGVGYFAYLHTLRSIWPSEPGERTRSIGTVSENVEFFNRLLTYSTRC